MNPLSKILWGVGLAVAFVVLVAFVYLVVVNAHLKTQLAQAQANDTACRLANDDFVAEVARQNEIVGALRSETLAREKQAQTAEAQAHKQAHIYWKAAAKVLSHKAGQNICASSENMMNDYLKDAP
jgi:hypothetical protein